MKSNTTLYAVLLLGAALLLAPSAAEAQFPGDVFFADPSIAVPEGGSATFEVLLFSGAQAVGATHVDVVFDPALAEVVTVQAGDTEELAPGHVSVVTPGRAAVVDLNGVSLNQPIGTSSLARVEIRALAPAGTTIPLGIQVRSLLETDTTPLSGGRGFAGELVVVSGGGGGGGNNAAAGLVVQGAATAPADRPDLVERALELRRPGQAVEVLELVQQGSGVTAVPHRLVVPDPAAPSEAEEAGPDAP